MKRLYVVLIAVMLCATTYAQDWVLDSDGTGQYNCDVVRSVVAEYGDQVYFQSDDAKYTVAEYYNSTIPGCDLTSGAAAYVSEESYIVTVQDVVNLRECASRSCSWVGSARSGDMLEVIGEDGDWLEVKHKDATAFIAGWLTTRVVDAPAGLLADFQFNAFSPAGELWAVMYGSTGRTGTHWLNLTRADGSNTDIQLEALVWESDNASSWFQRPVFFGWGGNDWELLPELIPDSSFYVYLPSDEEVYEFPVSNSAYTSGFQLGFDMASRPAGIRAGTPVRVLVADSGQADHIKDWVGSVVAPQAVEPPARPAAPTLVAGDGQVTVIVRSTPPEPGGEAISTFELRYRELGSGEGPTQIGSVNEGDFVVDNLTNGQTYQFALAAINRGGKGPYSAFSSAIPGS